MTTTSIPRLLMAGATGLSLCLSFPTLSARGLGSMSGNGCPPEDSADQASKGTVYFKLDSSRLDRRAKCELKRLASFAIAQSASKVLVTGHADQLGNQAYNLALSQRRAAAVLNRLKALGVHPSILEMDWKGEFDPAVAVDSDQVQPLNRRVEVQLNF